MPTNTKIVEIYLTRQHFESSIITEAILAEGIQVELVSDNEEPPGLQPSFPYKLLVHAHDVEVVKTIIGRSHPDVL